MKPRRTFTPEQKMAILRELLEEKIPISQLAEKYQIHTNDIYNWKKKLFLRALQIYSVTINQRTQNPRKKRR